MPDKKLTDSEIVKALECCSMQSYPACKECPYHDNYSNRECIGLRNADIKDLINRQKAQLFKEQNKNSKLRNERNRLQAEVERLEKDSKRLEKVEMQLDDAMKMYDTIKAEAYKEFAERLKEAPIKCALPLLGLSTKDETEDYFNDIMLQVRDVINNLLKELVGDNQ